MGDFLFGFEEQLMDEYFRNKRQIEIELAYIDKICQGFSINKKRKNGKTYYYREKRVQGRVVSQYVKKADVPELLKNQEEANYWKENIAKQKEFLKRVERYFGKKAIKENEPYYTSKQYF